MPNVETYAAPLVVTLAYVAVYYGFMVHILGVKSRLVREYKSRGEKFDRYHGQDRFMLAADRLQLNTLEHMPPFLALMWLCAVFVDPMSAAIAGGIYVASRIAYPFVIGKRLGRGIRARVLFATGTGYVVMTYYLCVLIWALVTAP